MDEALAAMSTEEIAAPADLEKRVRAYLAEHPEASWTSGRGARRRRPGPQVMTDAGLTFDEVLKLTAGKDLIRVGGREPQTIWLWDLGRSEENPSWPRYAVFSPRAEIWREASVVYWRCAYAVTQVDDVVLARRLARGMAAIWRLPLEVDLKPPHVVSAERRVVQ